MSEIGQKLIDAVREVAAHYPDHKYVKPTIETGMGDDSFGSCVYVYDGCPSCLIGHGLWDVGLIDEDFEDLAQNMDGITTVSLLSKVAELQKLNGNELYWLRVVQRLQDNGYAWGYAVRAADNQFGLVPA